MRNKLLFGVVLALAIGTTLATAQVVIFSDTFNSAGTGINDDLASRQSGTAATLQWINIAQTDTTGTAAVSGNAGVFNHGYTGISAAGIDTHSIWTLSSDGTTPYDFYSSIGGQQWSLTFNANVNAATATDRLRIYVIDSATPVINEGSVDIGWQLSAGTGTASAQGVKLMEDGSKINWPDATTASNGQTARTYQVVVNEGAGFSFTSSVDSASFADGVGTIGNLGANERYLFLHVWDRQVSTTSPPNLVGTVDSIELALIPEPSSVAVGLLGALALFGAARRRV